MSLSLIMLGSALCASPLAPVRPSALCCTAHCCAKAPHPHPACCSPGPPPPSPALALPPLHIDPAGITISGISSGADFVVNLHVAHSSIISGVGVFAGQACELPPPPPQTHTPIPPYVHWPGIALYVRALTTSRACDGRSLRGHKIPKRAAAPGQPRRACLRRLPRREDARVNETLVHALLRTILK